MPVFNLSKQDFAYILSGLTREANTYRERAGNLIALTDYDLRVKHQFRSMAEGVHALHEKIRKGAEGQAVLTLTFDLDENNKVQI